MRWFRRVDRLGHWPPLLEQDGMYPGSVLVQATLSVQHAMIRLLTHHVTIRKNRFWGAGDGSAARPWPGTGPRRAAGRTRRRSSRVTEPAGKRQERTAESGMDVVGGLRRENVLTPLSGLTGPDTDGFKTHVLSGWSRVFLGSVTQSSSAWIFTSSLAYRFDTI